MDVFSFGLLLHYCLTAGRHPFGEQYERDGNILQRRLNLKHVQHLPEAVNLLRGCCEPKGAREGFFDWVTHLCAITFHGQVSPAPPPAAAAAADPDHRPAMTSVMVHPLWWPVTQRLAFLITISDRVENEDRMVRAKGCWAPAGAESRARAGAEMALGLGLVLPGLSRSLLLYPPHVRYHPTPAVQEDRRLYQALECCAPDAVGTSGSWASVMDSGLVNNLGGCRAGGCRAGVKIWDLRRDSPASCAGHACPRRCRPTGKYRKYSYSSLRDLLRVIRNKHNHFRCVIFEHLLCV